MKIKKLSIIVPVYNEIATVEKVMKRLTRLNLGKIEKEIVVVDDGSTDGTTESLRRHSKSRLKNFKYIFQKKNQGKGAAVRSALTKTTGDYVIIQDADLEYDPGEIKRLIDKTEEEGLPVVYGSRDREVRNKYIYPHYYWGSRGMCWLINLLYHTRITDPETCYKLIRTDIAKKINLGEKGFGFDMEITLKILKMNIKIDEIGIHYKPRSFQEGKKITIGDGLRAIYLIFKYYRER